VLLVEGDLVGDGEALVRVQRRRVQLIAATVTVIAGIG
jgi:hypothetical protein